MGAKTRTIRTTETRNNRIDFENQFPFYSVIFTSFGPKRERHQIPWVIFASCFYSLCHLTAGPSALSSSLTTTMSSKKDPNYANHKFRTFAFVSFERVDLIGRLFIEW